MLQDIEDYVYHCEYTAREPINDQDYLLVFDGDRLLFHAGENLALPKIDEVDAGEIEKNALQYLFPSTITHLSVTAFAWLRKEICA